MWCDAISSTAQSQEIRGIFDCVCACLSCSLHHFLCLDSLKYSFEVLALDWFNQSTFCHFSFKHCNILKVNIQLFLFVSAFTFTFMHHEPHLTFVNLLFLFSLQSSVIIYCASDKIPHDRRTNKTREKVEIEQFQTFKVCLYSDIKPKPTTNDRGELNS